MLDESLVAPRPDAVRGQRPVPVVADPPRVRGVRRRPSSRRCATEGFFDGAAPASRSSPPTPTSPVASTAERRPARSSRSHRHHQDRRPTTSTSPAPRRARLDVVRGDRRPAGAPAATSASSSSAAAPTSCRSRSPTRAPTTTSPPGASRRCDAPSCLQANPDRSSPVAHRGHRRARLRARPTTSTRPTAAPFPDPARPAEGVCKGVLDAAGIVLGRRRALQLPLRVPVLRRHAVPQGRARPGVPPGAAVTGGAVQRRGRPDRHRIHLFH